MFSQVHGCKRKFNQLDEDVRETKSCQGCQHCRYHQHIQQVVLHMAFQSQFWTLAGIRTDGTSVSFFLNSTLLMVDWILTCIPFTSWRLKGYSIMSWNYALQSKKGYVNFNSTLLRSLSGFSFLFEAQPLAFLLKVYLEVQKKNKKKTFLVKIISDNVLSRFWMCPSYWGHRLTFPVMEKFSAAPSVGRL